MWDTEDASYYLLVEAAARGGRGGGRVSLELTKVGGSRHPLKYLIAVITLSADFSLWGTPGVTTESIYKYSIMRRFNAPMDFPQNGDNPGTLGAFVTFCAYRIF